MERERCIRPPERPPARFRAFRQFNDPALAVLARQRHRVGPRARGLFPSERMTDRIARALCDHKAIDIKELLESFEFLARVRRRLRGPHVVDLCCGHGLTGLLFGLLERRVERVTLLDRRRPDSFSAVLTALCEIGPWLAPKVRYVEADLASLTLERTDSLLAVHACGPRTDHCLTAAIAVGAPIAVMPCCYTRTARDAPTAIRVALGRAMTTDIHRTYRLERAGYQVDWSEIPVEITPMNRVIVAWNPPRAPADQSM